MKTEQSNKNQDKDFVTNQEYIQKNLKKVFNKINNFEDKIYFELSKSEILDYIKEINEKIKNWNNYYFNEEYNLIIKDYKEVESIISELEMCLVDYDKNLNISGISYAIYEIGQYLLEKRNESVKNGE